jgi:hypothetical protein
MPLVPNFWIYKNSIVSTVGTLLAPLAGRWHVFFADVYFQEIASK